ncbi:hypothetical protein VNI00_008566 [Paramarasmius palmivorus]|uniref:Arrestin-like N-terminal domain-containing protein n=1 Tax=Paramarasmius palmivorus TaxID=297713 RepID=A0AAW0CW94_9AGAR
MDSSTYPPSYSATIPSPNYSSDPAEDEQRLAYQRSPTHGALTGIFVRKEGQVTVILENQREGTSEPEYGRRSAVSGSIVLHQPSVITEVKVRLRGSVEFLTLSQGFAQKDLCDETQVLYDKEAESTECPSSLPFSLIMPSTFQHGQKHYPFPPSYDVQLFSENIQYAKVAYFLTVMVTKSRKGPTALLLGKNQQKYRPRSRPPRPIPYDHSFLSTIKVCPEEWHQSSCTIEPRLPESDLQPVSCQLFLPSVGVYEMTESIPFHIQLIGTSSTLQRLCSQSKGNPPVMLRLLRQLVLDVNGRQVAINLCLGEAKICSPPPTLDGGSQDTTAVNLEGEIKVEMENFTVPSFDSGIVATRDHIALELSKSKPDSNALFKPLKHIQVLKLVTDPWSDTPDPFS